MMMTVGGTLLWAHVMYQVQAKPYSSSFDPLKQPFLQSVTLRLIQLCVCVCVCFWGAGSTIYTSPLPLS